MIETVDITSYKRRYSHDGNLSQALYITGDNHEFEKWSQPAFMMLAGLKPNHKFLDFGCGCLRGTVRLVDYLDEGNFYGVDVSEGLISQALPRIESQGIKKKANLFALNNYNLKDLLKTKFNFILSVSVFTHLLPDSLPEVFRGISDVLEKDGVYYFTMYPSETKDFEGDIEVMMYKKSYLAKIAAQHGLKVVDISGDFPNPSPTPNYITRVNHPVMAQWVLKATLL